MMYYMIQRFARRKKNESLPSPNAAVHSHLQRRILSQSIIAPFKNPLRFLYCWIVEWIRIDWCRRDR